MYSLIKKILFLLDPELSHTIAMKGLKISHVCKISKLFEKHYEKPMQVMGLNFSNPIGLAAGLDKNGDYFEALAPFGFGFIEVGTITPHPQPGNVKPRLFRLLKEEAFINRLGFNNKGAEYLISRLKKKRYSGILGINIGKNHFTPLETALADYVFLFRKLAPCASYITVNISSPNTENLRDLQQGELLHQLLFTLKKEQALQNRYVPLVIKISPDLQFGQLSEMAKIFLEHQIDGLIATNTTIHRNNILNSPFAHEKGGLSGKPLFERSTIILQELQQLVRDKIPIIASGGIMNAQDAQKKFNAGASLLQLYTGFIYKGPRLIRDALMF